MAAPAAAGPISVATDNVADLISNSAEFQTWTSTADAAAAKLRIHQVALDEDVTPAPTYPLCALSFPTRMTFTRGGYPAEASMEAFFKDAIASGDLSDHLAVGRRFANSVGVIIQELYDLAEAGGALLVPKDGITLLQHPTRTMRAQEANSSTQFMVASFEIRWGAKLPG